MRTLRSRRTLLAVVAGTVASFGLLAGCSSFNDARGVGDAPVGTTHEAPRQVWANIDKFPNVAAFCIGENGVYTTTREAAPVVIANDPNCAEGGILRG
jgi:hypothetical protein